MILGYMRARSCVLLVVMGSTRDRPVRRGHWWWPTTTRVQTAPHSPHGSLDDAGLPPEIASKIRPVPITGCWEWVGAKDSRGYGNVKVGGRVRKAHRVIYELLRGPVPPNYECDHLCRVPWCVNPDHVEVVAHVENVRRGAARWVPGERQRAKRRCPQGHHYTKANTYIHPVSGGRWCRTCDREKKRAASKLPTAIPA